jgi:hypothetical protein
LAVSREGFTSNPEIAVTDGDGVTMQRCTENTLIDGSPSVSPIESDEVDVSQF